MQGTLSHEAARAICDHMNDDHAGSVADYARAFAGLPETTAARLVAIDAAGMDLEVTLSGDRIVPARIAFDRPLADATDARDTLIAMARRASAP